MFGWMNRYLDNLSELAYWFALCLGVYGSDSMLSRHMVFLKGTLMLRAHEVL
ncbi:hypothetical protein XHV734_3650 [Xanthomonas hortorum pv. vitians]|nr:hypothetical protein XHV734_3650 [Xanthomonas hortorum pv. vitians]